MLPVFFIWSDLIYVPSLFYLVGFNLCPQPFLSGRILFMPPAFFIWSDFFETFSVFYMVGEGRCENTDIFVNPKPPYFTLARFYNTCKSMFKNVFLTKMPHVVTKLLSYFKLKYFCRFSLSSINFKVHAFTCVSYFKNLK